MGTFGRSSVGLRGSTGGGVAPPTPSGPPHRGTPPGQGGIQILARGSWTSLRSCSVSSSSPSRTCSSPRFSSLDRVLHIPVVPQKGDPTVHSLNKVVAVVVYDSCPCSRQCWSTSQFRTVEVPQIQSSTEFNDDFEAVLANFSDSPERG